MNTYSTSQDSDATNTMPNHNVTPTSFSPTSDFTCDIEDWLEHFDIELDPGVKSMTLPRFNKNGIRICDRELCRKKAVPNSGLCRVHLSSDLVTCTSEGCNIIIKQGLFCARHLKGDDVCTKGRCLEKIVVNNNGKKLCEHHATMSNLCNSKYCANRTENYLNYCKIHDDAIKIKKIEFSEKQGILERERYLCSLGLSRRAIKRYCSLLLFRMYCL
ncbi:hypothetical protein AKO1_000924 [Acrasis kona]|uniref:Uncharacterized protein n=1 Tax=Acrasis kona TaxID=1008807 RepID=A0AAW2ZQD1_9EUKA